MHEVNPKMSCRRAVGRRRVHRLDPRTIVLADKAYDADGIRNLIEAQGAVPNIPAKSNRKWKPCFSKVLYRERNLIERFFSKLKHFRRIATRYEKLAENFLAMVKLASMRLWLRVYESTTYSNEPEPTCLFPLEATGRDSFVAWLEAQPGYNDRELARAMGSTKVAR